jgi:hypothetical protein
VFRFSSSTDERGAPGSRPFFGALTWGIQMRIEMRFRVISIDFK